MQKFGIGEIRCQQLKFPCILINKALIKQEESNIFLNVDRMIFF